ncbi:MAG: hypothetical protein JXX29_10420 [Deltaproteobacteria bacterium]|nr:hypothetical protein [Deltaproteobacteria bacterium]MBN2672081.1 hypothetical protein [Deltaproteobacteria bacterium]
MRYIPVRCLFLLLFFTMPACGSTPVQPAPPTTNASMPKSPTVSTEPRSRPSEPPSKHNDGLPDGLTVVERRAIEEGLANISVEQIDPNTACPSCILIADAITLQTEFSQAVSKWQSLFNEEQSKVNNASSLPVNSPELSARRRCLVFEKEKRDALVQALYTADWPETQNAVLVADGLSKSVQRCSFEEGYSIFSTDTEEMTNDLKYDQYRKWLAKGLVYYLLQNEEAAHAFLSRLPESLSSAHIQLYASVIEAGLEATTYRNIPLQSVIDLAPAVAQSKDALLQLRYNLALARTYTNNGYPATALDQLQRIVDSLEQTPEVVRWADGRLLTDVYSDAADGYAEMNRTQAADRLYEKILLNIDCWFELSAEKEHWVYLESGRNALTGIKAAEPYWQNHASRALAHLRHAYNGAWGNKVHSSYLRGQTLYLYTDALIALNRLNDATPLLQKGLDKTNQFWMSANVPIGGLELLAAIAAHKKSDAAARDEMFTAALSKLEVKKVSGGIFNLSEQRTQQQIRGQRFLWYQSAIQKFIQINAIDIAQQLSSRWQTEHIADKKVFATIQYALAMLYLEHHMPTAAMQYMKQLPPVVSQTSVSPKDAFGNTQALFTAPQLATLDVMYGMLLHQLKKEHGDTYIENGLRKLTQQTEPAPPLFGHFESSEITPYSNNMQQAILLLNAAERFSNKNLWPSMVARALAIPLTGVEKNEIALRAKKILDQVE